ncbi:MAG: type III pantothenate kinase [Reichenbachiella sp.]
MKTLVLDIGNSNIKVATFENSILTEKWVFQDLNDVKPLIEDVAPDQVAACSVVQTKGEIENTLAPHKVLVVDHNTQVPVKNNYGTKETLGIDRLVAVVGATEKESKMPHLIIDIGTCITYDFLDDERTYQGGSISPGVELRFKSMHDYTANLPLILAPFEANLTAKSTKEAMVAGVMYGIVNEIDGVIMQYRQIWTDLKVIVCGGGANSFESKIKASIFAAPDLVLIGLNRILEYNDKSI